MSVRAARAGLLITLLALAVLEAPAGAATAEGIWFPVELPLDGYSDTWGAPRGGGRTHEGTDVLAPQMRRVYAAEGGEIIKALGETCRDGQMCESYYLAVAGDDGRGYFYVHLNDDTPGRPNGCDGLGGVEGAFSPRLVQVLAEQGTLVGTRVERGEHIGWVGSSGNAACGVDQLHFEIWSDHDWGATGKVNPYPELAAAEAIGRTGQAVTADVARDAGDNRVTTAIALSRAAYAAAGQVVLAPAGAYVPALVAGPLAALHDAPVLLVPDVGDPPEALIDELRRLGAHAATAVGDVNPQALHRLAAAADLSRVDRLEAEDPIALSVVVADAVLEAGGEPDQVVLAPYDADDDSRGWPDALLGSTLAAYQQAPVLLTARDRLSTSVTGFLAERGTSTADVIGGTAVIGGAVEDDLEDADVTVRRLAGSTRLTTAMAVTDALLDDHVGASPRLLHVATAGAYPDALAAGPSVMVRGSVLLLLDEVERSSDVLEWIAEHAGEIDDVHAVGGPAALSDEAVTAVIDRIS